MTPNELAKSGSEHGHQRALFAWCAMAQRFGFEAAWDERCYTDMRYATLTYEAGHCVDPIAPAVPELEWFHAIPNGGSRGDDAKSRAIQGGKLKAEGVKKGVPDCFLPLPMWATINGPDKCIVYAGLYIEMKRAKSEGKTKGRETDEQSVFIAYVRSKSYAASVCFTWDQAAKELQTYIQACRSRS